ncbi:MAG TPA: cytochrome P460 family protein [Geobacteraceae bacterium]
MMKRWWLAITLVLAAAASTTGKELPVAANGVALFPGYEQWRVIAPSVRPDKEQVRVILGNDLAFQAFQAGKRPFPDGAVLAKVAWSTRKHERFPVALVPDKFAQVEFMVKDAVKYKTSGGWGFARFVGNELKPYGKDGGFVQECFGCHLPMADNDYVFTAVPLRP